ncbi:MAG: MBL fold metallo-hydrolase [Chlamydiota bacterium]|nr:MBL fold metallo-hydrolase [Chlamydiota bacterium]
MEIIILGSGTGVISLKRGSPGYLMRTQKAKLLIDSGTGTLHQMIRHGINPTDIDAIFYTHTHPDHICDLVPFLFSLKYTEPHRTHPLSIFGGPGFKGFFEKLTEVYLGWITPQTFALNVIEMKGSLIHFLDMSVRAVPVVHNPESVAYRFEESQYSAAFSGDSDMCDGLVEVAKESDIYFIECSFPDQNKKRGHLTASEVAHVACLAKPKKLVLTHIYPQNDNVSILNDIKKDYDGEVILAMDNMIFKNDDM